MDARGLSPVSEAGDLPDQGEPTRRAHSSGATPIRKGLFTSQFLARLIYDKYVLGRPLERIVAALRAEGLEIAEGTLVGALRAVSHLLEPLDQAIRARNAAAGHLHIDKTSWAVFEDVERD